MTEPHSSPSARPVDIDVERRALAEAKEAVALKLDQFSGIRGGGADQFADEYIDAVVAGTIQKLQQDLVVFGRIDDDQPWRVGLYGIDSRGEQLVIDWRAPFAAPYYRAHFEDPRGLRRRVTYVGSITDLFVEDFESGGVEGSSPLLGELARSRGTEMRAAVATLQTEQDRLVRLDPDAQLVLRGGPGTGKTVVGLHRAAWLVYNDTRLTAGRILVVGPSDRFLRFVSAVLPTLGEARIHQTTFERLLGRSTDAGSDERWLPVLDRLEATFLRPGPIKAGLVRVREEEVTDLVNQVRARSLPWRDRRKVFVELLATRHGVARGAMSKAAADVWPTVTTRQVLAMLRRRTTLESLDTPPDLIDAWLDDPHDGALADEIRARVEGTPATYGHVIVDEAQDLSLLQLRAMRRRSGGLTLVGDDAQRSNPRGLGLRRAAAVIGVETEEMTTAYRMSAEIAAWLNEHASAHGIDAVQLTGIRPTGVPVRDVVGAAPDLQRHEQGLRDRWPNVARIGADDAWEHKGVEYDAVVVDALGMTDPELYLAASRAAHELVVVRRSPA